MLDALRKRAGGLTARILLAVLVISFAVWGVNDMFRGSSGNVIGTVGGQDITATDFQRRYQDLLNQIAQSFGGVTPAQAEQFFGVTNIALQSLAGEATIEDQADRLGLGVSREAMARSILADPRFQGATGQFNSGAYQSYLRQLWGNEGTYLAEGRRPEELRAQIEEAVRGPQSPLPDTYRAAIHEYENEARTLLYTVLTPASLGELPAPTEEQIANYYQENVANWGAPETRTARVLELTPAALADPAAVTEEQILAAYEARKFEFGEPETRHVWWEQAVPADRAARIEALLAAGATFDDLVLQGEIAPTDLGTVDADDFRDPARAIDPAIGDAAFALALDGTTVLPGRFGLSTLVHVSEINPAVVPPLSQIRDTIVDGVAREQAAPRIAGLWEQIEDARAGGATLEEAAARVGVPTTTHTFDADGNDANGIAIPGLPGGTELLTNVFVSAVGDADPPLDLPGNGGYVWYDVLGTTPAHQRPLEEVRDQVVSAWQDAENATRLQTLADSIVTRVRNGENFYTVAAENALALEVAEGIKRTSTATENLSDAAILEAFAGPRGHVGAADGVGDGDKVVLQVVDAAVPLYVAGALTEEQTAAIRNELADNLFVAYADAAFRRAGGMRNYNPTLIGQITGLAAPQ